MGIIFPKQKRPASGSFLRLETETNLDCQSNSPNGERQDYSHKMKNSSMGSKASPLSIEKVESTSII